MTKTDRHYDYLTRHWEVLAASAWKRYKKHGRGVVVIRKCGAFGSPDAPKYLPWKLVIDPDFIKGLAQMVEEYEPQKEVVVIFLDAPDDVSAYKARSQRGVGRRAGGQAH
jgi:hypothetical protein